MSEYRKVWRDRTGADWFEQRNAVVFGPVVEHKVVPADAIVIERGDLPEVDPERPNYSGYVGLTGPGSAEDRPVALFAPARHMERAMEEIALSLYAAAHPPVDEVAVEALAVHLIETEQRNDDYRNQARRLLATGRVHVDTTEVRRG